MMRQLTFGQRHYLTILFLIVLFLSGWTRLVSAESQDGLPSNAHQTASTPYGGPMFVVNSNGDEGDNGWGDEACKTNSGTCTLRAAIEETNAVGFGQPVLIEFATPMTIQPQSELPEITEPMWIDGRATGSAKCPSDVNDVATLEVALDGVLLSAGDGLQFGVGSDGSYVYGMSIGRFPDIGIVVNSDDFMLGCNFIGLSVTGGSGYGNGAGVFAGGDDSLIGGSSFGDRNVISGNGSATGPGYGLVIGGLAEGALVWGNFIGTDTQGDSAIPNQRNGISVAGGVTIGGNDIEERNVISGNGLHGVNLGTISVDVVVEGNVIGRNWDESQPLGNGGHGIAVTFGSYRIGGSSSNRGNLISDNGGYGIYLKDEYTELDHASINTVWNNVIGNNGSSTAFGNAGGIYVGAMHEVRIDANVIAGNHTNAGIVVACNEALIGFDNPFCIDGVANAHDEVTIEDNYIGVRSTGTLLVPSSVPAIHFIQAEAATVQRNTIAASTASADFLIESGGDHNGDSIGNTITENEIGISASGGTHLNSGTDGLVLANGSTSNTVSLNQIAGDTGAAVVIASDDNTISDNSIGTNTAGTLDAGSAIGLHVDGGHDNVIEGNQIGYHTIGVQLEEADRNILYGNGIGTDTAGSLNIGNSSHGVYITNESLDNQVGGDVNLPYNQIRNNGGVGMLVFDTAIGVSRGNSFFASEYGDNGLLAIDLNNDDVTPNDDAACDSDVGANDLQNYPTIDNVTGSGNVQGTFKSLPSRTYRLDVFTSASCDVFGHGEGEQFYGSAVVALGVSGESTFSVPQANGETPLAYYSAIATNLTTGDTSEFSACYMPVPTAITMSGQPSAVSSQQSAISGQLVAAFVGLILLGLFVMWQGRRGVMVLAVVLLALTLFGALHPESVEAAKTSSCGTFDDLLEDGSVAQSGAGIVIGAITGTLSEPVRISALTVPTPSPEYDEPAIVASSYYGISAETTISTPLDKPLIVGVPVPNGFSPTNLAVALLQDGQKAEDINTSDFIWRYTQVAHDSTNDLLTFTLTDLTPENQIFVVVEHSSFELLPSPTRQTEGIGETQATTSFSIMCPFASCSPTAISAYEAELLAALNDFIGHGFRLPNLISKVGGIDTTNSEWLPYLISGATYYNILLAEPSYCDGFLGAYYPDPAGMTICSTTTPISPAMKETIRHELFHAVQWAYPTRAGNSEAKKWTTEGTATAAEKSAPTNIMIHDGEYGWHSIHDTLTSTTSNHEYQAEDFWVHYGLTQGLSLGYLHSFFEEGFTVSDIDVAMGGTIEAEYQKYVVNNAFTVAENYGGQLANPCSLQAPHIVDGAQPLVWHDPAASCTSADQDVSLAPLTGMVYSVATTESLDDMFVWLDIHTGNDLAYYVYEEWEGSCHLVPEGPRHLQASPSDNYYVVIANGSKFSNASFDVVVQGCNEE